MASFFPGLDTKNEIRFYAEDPLIILGSCLFFFVLRKLLNKFVYKPFADYLKLDQRREKKSKNSKYGRFVEDIWYSTFYPISTICFFLILQDKDWFWDPYLSVKDLGVVPHPHLHEEM
jgi:hypothetical protein